MLHINIYQINQQNKSREYLFQALANKVFILNFFHLLKTLRNCVFANNTKNV